MDSCTAVHAMRLVLIYIFIFGHGRPIVQGIPQWLPASPAEAEALPHEGASALVLVLTMALYVLHQSLERLAEAMPLS